MGGGCYRLILGLLRVDVVRLVPLGVLFEETEFCMVGQQKQRDSLFVDRFLCLQNAKLEVPGEEATERVQVCKHV